MWCVVLQPKGTTRNAVLQLTAIPTPENVGTILRRATPPELIGTYKWSGHIVYLFAYKTGKAGTENKHELPPPHDTVLLFGEAVMIATKTGVPVSFGTAEYTKFYNESFGGFEDLGSEDSEDDEAEDDEEAEDEEEEAEEEEEEEEGEFDEDEEEPVRPPPKATKTKRGAKKAPNYYTQSELVAEDYTLVKK